MGTPATLEGEVIQGAVTGSSWREDPSVLAGVLQNLWPRSVHSATGKMDIETGNPSGEI